VQNNAVVGNTLLNNFISGIIVHSNAPGDVLSETVVIDNTLVGNGPDPEVGAMQPAGIVVAGDVEPVTDTVISNNSVTNEYYGIFLDNGLPTSLNNNQVTATVPVAPGLELYTPTHARQAGVNLSFAADAPAVQAPLYQFWVDSAQGWKMAQNYSPNPNFTLPSAAAGSYEVAAFALTPSQLAQGD
jgi:nitrous oxidase accessory protein NosD